MARSNSNADRISGDRQADRQEPVVRICFLLLPNFSLLSVSSAMDPIRMANKVLGFQKFKVDVCSLDGSDICSSSDHPFPVDGKLDDLQGAEFLLVCSSDHVEQLVISPSLAGKLRSLVSRGTTLGALCTGAYVLARLGFLEGYSCTIHWEYASMFRENFPFIDLKQDVFVVDRNRLTCAGGTAALDLVLLILGQSCSSDTVKAVADMAIHHDQRWGDTDQRVAIGRRLGISQPAVLRAISLMEDNIETPLTCPDIAEKVGIGVRQLQRLFNSILGTSPVTYYVNVRLNVARDLVSKTSMPMSKISYACGFASPANFAKQYRNRFSTSPQQERQEAAGAAESN